MAWKYIVMMKLFIFVLRVVQAIDLAGTSFSPSALPNQYVHSFELDGVEGILHACFEGWVKYCEKKHQPDLTLLHRSCVVEGVTNWM
jgi:hypothetical protein